VGKRIVYIPIGLKEEERKENGRERRQRQCCEIWRGSSGLVFPFACLPLLTSFIFSVCAAGLLFSLFSFLLLLLLLCCCCCCCCCCCLLLLLLLLLLLVVVVVGNDNNNALGTYV